MKRAVILLLPTLACAGEAESVREALRQNRPPWYDPSADSWRRIEVSEPETASRMSGDQLPGLQLIVLLLVIGLVAAVGWALWQLGRLGRTGLVAEPAPGASGQARAAPDLSLLPLPDIGLPPDEGLRRALAAGDWHRAVVWAHARLLTRLDAAGALRLERGATDLRLLAEAQTWAEAKASRRRASAALAQTGAAFAAVYFGHATADRTLVDGLLAAIAEAERSLAAEGA